MTTTAGDLDLRIPKLRTGSYFPSLLEGRRRVDQGRLNLAARALQEDHRGMDPAVQGALVGGSLTLAVAIAGPVAQASQARATRRHEQRLQRQPDLRAACAVSTNEMRKADEWQVRYERQYGIEYASQPFGPDGDTPVREEADAEAALQDLLMVADDGLYAVARAYLDEHYRVWWGPLPGTPPDTTADLSGARDRFVIAARIAIYGG